MAKYVNKVCQPMSSAALSILISNILKCGGGFAVWQKMFNFALSIQHIEKK